MTPPLVFVIDTREARPYRLANAVYKKLTAGDYSVEGWESKIAVERKSLDDLINTVLHSRKRFTRELAILNTYQFAAVLVEASIHEIEQGQYTSTIKPHNLFGIIRKLKEEYPKVQWVFARNRPIAVTFVCGTLTAWVLRHREEERIGNFDDSGDNVETA